MRLDAADLAILELDVEKLDPLARDVAKTLIDRIREDDDTVERATKGIEEARRKATDAASALSKLVEKLDDDWTIDIARLTDEIETALENIQEIEF